MPFMIFSSWHTAPQWTDMTFWIVRLCVLCLFSMVPVAASSSASAPLECDMYLADSTIPHAGMGVFSGVAKKKGDFVGNGDVVFPLLDIPAYNAFAPIQVDPFENYVWDGTTMGMGKEVAEETGTVTTLWPGLDCAINCLIPLENVYRAFPQHNSHGDPLPYMPHRARDPGAGAITTYRSGRTVVKRDVPAGGELFKHYGDHWFTTRSHVFDRGFPLSNNFPQAQYLLKTFAEKLKFPPLYDMMLELRNTWKTSRTLNVLPITKEDIDLALENDVTHIYQKNATRSIEWLQQHGTCIDHIVHRASTIQGAGEGAFAKRALPQGTVVTGSPLLIIHSETFMDMVDWYFNEETGQWEKPPPPYHKQIMYNYCLGHEDSTILLFPYGAVGANYINHNASMTNIKIQWAEHGKLRHDEAFFKVSPDDMAHAAPNLGIEYVALRDIAEGEELFLDYGATWDLAWQRHVEQWTPPPPEVSTIASDWNERAEEPIRTRLEQARNPYPNTIELRCHSTLLDPRWKEVDSPEIWRRYPNKTGVDEYHYVYGAPCTVLDRSADNSTYKVAIFVDTLTWADLPEEAGEDGLRLEGVPREAFFFLDATYKSDLYLEGAFRHHIRIPDEMMPDAWRNKVSNTDQTSSSSLSDEL